ncbi:formate dehydrogenase accessory sulfurtransferase FdhD [Corynebacterium flavescens]|uniref:formate dehydrogenase accessory sulfurtransferase FdhD n=1 Tax=Corynebacterium flavescens TaxID=28028 RepID=UPI0023F3B672
MSRLSSSFAVTTVHLADDRITQVDTRAGIVPGEETLEVRLDGAVLATVARTPGHDIDLAHGLLFSRGLIRRAGDVDTARYCAGADATGTNAYNRLDLSLTRRPQLAFAPTTAAANPEPGSGRGSDCAASPSAAAPIAQLQAELELHQTNTKRAYSVDPLLIGATIVGLHKGRRLFHKTGGTHAAAACDEEGNPVVLREDITAGNCVPQVVGALLLDAKLPASKLVLALSYTPDFATIRLAALVGFSAVISAEVPSSQAVDAARAAGIVLVGRASEQDFSLYAGELRP